MAAGDDQRDVVNISNPSSYTDGDPEAIISEEDLFSSLDLNLPSREKMLSRSKQVLVYLSR